MPRNVTSPTYPTLTLSRSEPKNITQLEVRYDPGDNLYKLWKDGTVIFSSELQEDVMNAFAEESDKHGIVNK